MVVSAGRREVSLAILPFINGTPPRHVGGPYCFLSWGEASETAFHNVMTWG
jgi:hypothetical protein